MVVVAIMCCEIKLRLLLLCVAGENYSCCYYVLWERILVVVAIMCCGIKLRLLLLCVVGKNNSCCY